MRKLIAMLAVCAGAMGLHAVTTGTSFEGLIPEGAESTNYVDVLDVAAAELSGTPSQYWGYSAASFDDTVDEFLVTTNYGNSAAYDKARNSILNGSATSYLSIATKKDQSVTRFAQTSHDGVAIETGGSYYFDSLVQFTAFETDKLASDVLGGDGKLAIWLQSDIDDDTLEPTSTNLMVSAGYLTSNGSGGYTATSTNYVCKIVGNTVDLFDGGWHRVTVKAFDTIYVGSTVPAFAIAIDGIAVEITNDIYTAGIDDSLLTARAAQYFNNNQRLFPSAKVGDSTVASVSFQGVGLVDDLVFSDITDVKSLSDDGFTVKLGENVTSAEYSVDGGASSEITEDTLIPYTEGMEVTIANIVYGNGYMKKGCGPTVTGVEIVTNDASYVVTVSAANKSVTIDAQAIGATIVDSDGTPIVTPCATLADAFALINAGDAGTAPFTVTLNDSVTESITLTGNYSVTLDLAGNTITGVSGGSAIAIDNGASLTITNSVGEGKVVQGNEGIAVYVGSANSWLTISGGIYDGFINCDAIYDDRDPRYHFSIPSTGVKFLASVVDEYMLGDLEDAVATGLGAGYELAVGTGADAGYYVVQEAGGGTTPIDTSTGSATYESPAEATAAAAAVNADKESNIIVTNAAGASVVSPGSDYYDYVEAVPAGTTVTIEFTADGVVAATNSESAATLALPVAEVAASPDGASATIPTVAGFYYSILTNTAPDSIMGEYGERKLGDGSDLTLPMPNLGEKGFYKVKASPRRVD